MNTRGGGRPDISPTPSCSRSTADELWVSRLIGSRRLPRDELRDVAWCVEASEEDVDARATGLFADGGVVDATVAVGVDDPFQTSSHKLLAGQERRVWEPAKIIVEGLAQRGSALLRGPQKMRNRAEGQRRS